MSRVANLLVNPPGDTAQEHFDTLLQQPGVRIERIVSNGQVTLEGEWYDQSWDEWVLVLQGEAKLKLENTDALYHLVAGDHLFLPAGCRHRVAWTHQEQPTIWLAIHIGEPVEPEEV